MGRKRDPEIEERLREIIAEELHACRGPADFARLLGLDEPDETGALPADPDVWGDMAEDVDRIRDQQGLEVMIDAAIQRMEPPAYNRLRHRATAQLSRERNRGTHKKHNGGASQAPPGPVTPIGSAFVDLDTSAIQTLDTWARRLGVDRSEAVRRLAHVADQQTEV